MDHQEYKSLHESYMKNNSGSTIEETFMTIVPSFFTTFLSVNLIAVIKPDATLLTFGIEFVLIALSIVLNVTILHHRIWEIVYTLFFVVATAAGKQLYKRTHLAPFVQIPCRRPAHITVVRSVINIITAVCILAVDFRCFPRKLAKTETFGFSLMDSGVGLFVYSNGIIAPEIYKANSGHRISLGKVMSIILSCSPLFVLGLARFVVINEIDYQQHISEYGVHWNFFLTLAISKIIGTIILSMLPKIEYSKYAAILLLIVHETSLQLGLEKYVISEDNTVKRDNFVDANREGIVSILGYVALYVSSVYIGSLLKIETESGAKAKPTVKETVNVRTLCGKALRVFIISMVFWKISYVLRDLFGVSRRMANMGYVIWVLSIGTTMTTLFMLLEMFYHFVAFEESNMEVDDSGETNRKTYIPIILNAINYNGLAFFLGANLLTGLINLTFQTLLLGVGGSLFVLTVYMFVLCGVTTFLFVYKIKLKAW